MRITINDPNSRMAGLLSASALAIGLVAIVQPAAAGISLSKHNLGSTGINVNYVGSNDTGEICVFCHTPHGSNTDVAAPLWNKQNLTAASSYQSYNATNSATMQATTAGPGNISLACLSCHDGTQAMDNMVNASGFGGFTTATGASGANYTWTGARVASDGRMINAGGSPNFQAMLTTDLRNDHPVGINYCAATPDNSSIATTAACNDKDFKTGIGGGTSRAWLETGGNATFSTFGVT